MLQVLRAAREAKIRVFYAMHRRYRPGDYETWTYIAPVQTSAWKNKTFAYGTWGGKMHPGFVPQPGEVVASEHWCSSGFANTDLDLQLRKHGIQQLIIMGLIAHTCLEATVRFAAELGYGVTVVRDATADYSDREMHAALEVNISALCQPHRDSAGDRRIDVVQRGKPGRMKSASKATFRRQSTEVHMSNAIAQTPEARGVDMKLEIVVVPVSDVDRAKRFYAGLGWRLDADYATDDGYFRVIQVTPPGSGCSVISARTSRRPYRARRRAVFDRLRCRGGADGIARPRRGG